VVHFVEKHLTANGFEIYSERNIPVGVSWAKEIETRIRSADAVIPFLSTGTLQSEMFVYQLEVAHDAAQRQNGRPWLVPVCIQSPGPMPDMVALILGSLHQYVWHGPADNRHIADEVVRALEAMKHAKDAVPSPEKTPLRLRPRPVSPMPVVVMGGEAVPTNLEPIGGAVPLNSEYYIVRPQDGELRAAVNRFDSIVLIKGARQMGKTSLLARGLQQGRERGAKVVLTDFQKLNLADLESAANLYFTLAESIAEQLGLAVFPQDVWDEKRGANVNLGPGRSGPALYLHLRQ
jgi:hypothetical protein